MEETRKSGKLQQYFERLSPRERKMLVIWVFAMLGIALFLLSTTVLSSFDDMQTKIEENQEALGLIARKQGQYIAAKGKGKDSLESRLDRNDIRLTTYLDKQGSRFDVKISNFKDGSGPAGGRKGSKDASGVTEEWVTVDIDRVDYGKLTRFLDSIQTSNELLVIKRIEISRSRRGRGDQDTVDAKLTVSTFKKKREES